MQTAFGKLSYREQRLLEERNAACMTCGRCRTFEDLAVMFEGSSASGVDRTYRRAVEKLTVLMVEAGALHAIRLRQKSKTTRKRKSPAVYEYQADCDGEWGEIQFEFESGTAEIVRLADWDTTVTNVAKRTIRFLLD